MNGEASGGRLLTILLVVSAFGGALWLFFGQEAPSQARARQQREVTIDGRRYRCDPVPDEPVYVEVP